MGTESSRSGAELLDSVREGTKSPPRVGLWARGRFGYGHRVSGPVTRTGPTDRAATPPAAAVVLMAYGSPERIDDVPAYYADIRGGRPIAPENLADLVDRYRRLGIEDSNPLNAITEATRASLEAELGLPVHTGMKHWDPRVAEAVEQALAGGATEIVGLVLAPHYSRLSIAGYRRLIDEA